LPRAPPSTLFPYTTLFRSGSYQGLHEAIRCLRVAGRVATVASYHGDDQTGLRLGEEYHRNRITIYSSMTINGCPHRNHPLWTLEDRKSTRLNSSHDQISYA